MGNLSPERAENCFILSGRSWRGAFLSVVTGCRAVGAGEQPMEVRYAREAAIIGYVTCRIRCRGEQKRGFFKSQGIDVVSECVSGMFFDEFAQGRLVHFHIGGRLSQGDVSIKIYFKIIFERFPQVSYGARLAYLSGAPHKKRLTSRRFLPFQEFGINAPCKICHDL